MATILTNKIIEDASGKVDDYILNANSLYDELNGIITSLISNDFNGDASDGYKAFYDEKVIPALRENLTEGNSSLMPSIKSMLEGIREQLIGTVDPQLKENNINPG